MKQLIGSLFLSAFFALSVSALGCAGDSGVADPTRIGTDADAGTGTDVYNDTGTSDAGDINPGDTSSDQGTVDTGGEDGFEDPGFIDYSPDIDINLDTDGDTIPDGAEGGCAVDTDVDTIPDCRDLDSDGDGIPDSVEAGDDDPATPPRDTDNDRIPDFQDFDSDDDGIMDAIEGTADPDEDGKGNWIDPDSDGDHVGDVLEGREDADGDHIPNYLDLDSDGDTISDAAEYFDDTDSDSIPDRLDDDSDADGVDDRDEAGDDDVSTNPVDSDRDGLPDFQDPDSDDDGLYDGDETGCPGSSDRLDADSDDDGFSDLAETAVGSNPCGAGSTVYDFVEFFFVLPFEGEEDEDTLEFGTDLRQVDVHFNMDTTGSMSGEIANLRDNISDNIIPDIATALSGVGEVADVAFGVSEFRDFPVSPFGSPGDFPFRLSQRITTRASDAQSGADGLVHGGGNDGPESGWESLYQIATGVGGVSWGGTYAGSISPFNTGIGYIAGVADGTIGGVGFREGSFPVVVHITDNRSHTASEYGTSITGEHSRIQARNEMRNIRARVIGVASGSTPESELKLFATETYAEVPLCAFEDVWPVNSYCATNRCCTGENGASRTAEDGMCPLMFEISSTGTGLSSTIVDAISFLATSGSLEVTTRVVRDETAWTSLSVDTSCFIKSIIPNHADAPDICAGTPVMVDNYPPSGELDSFENVTPGTQVFFDVYAENDDCAEPTFEPQLFSATIEVLGDGVTVLDSLEVTVIVPPVDLSGPK